MGRYTTEANTRLTLDDGTVIGPGVTFEAEFLPEKAAFLVACGAITVAPESVGVAAAYPVVDPVADAVGVDGAPVPHAVSAGEPGTKE